MLLCALLQLSHEKRAELPLDDLTVKSCVDGRLKARNMDRDQQVHMISELTKSLEVLVLECNEGRNKKGEKKDDLLAEVKKTEEKVARWKSVLEEEQESEEEGEQDSTEEDEERKEEGTDNEDGEQDSTEEDEERKEEDTDNEDGESSDSDVSECSVSGTEETGKKRKGDRSTGGERVSKKRQWSKAINCHALTRFVV